MRSAGGLPLVVLVESPPFRAVDVVVGCSQFVLDRHLAGGYFPQASRLVIHNGDSRSAADAQPPARAPGKTHRLSRPADESQGLELMLDAALPTHPTGA